jgi:hypothetical protein
MDLAKGRVVIELVPKLALAMWRASRNWRGRFLRRRGVPPRDRGFMAQGGDPTGTGMGFHSRI